MANANSQPATVVNPTGAVWAASTSPMPYGPATTLTAMSTAAISTSGGGQAHANIQPYSVVNFCMALQGIFPSRN
jgi:microcystin-dependent protein